MSDMQCFESKVMSKNNQNSDQKSTAGAVETAQRWIHVPSWSGGTRRRTPHGMGSTPDSGNQSGRNGMCCVSSAEPQSDVGGCRIAASLEAPAGESEDSNAHKNQKPAPNFSSGIKERIVMENIDLDTLIHRIASACARANIEEMFLALGYRHGAAYAWRAPFGELKFVEALTEHKHLARELWDAEMVRIIQGCNILDAINSEEDFRLVVDENLANGKRLERSYVDGFIDGAFQVLYDRLTGDPDPWP